MEVAGVALALVELGHERQRLAVQRGDLFRTGLVDGVVVRGTQHLVVLEGDLVLTEVALALRGLDAQAGPVHVVADVAQQRFDPGAAEDRVVDVVAVGRVQVAVAAVPGLLVAVVEQQEFEFGAGHRLKAEPLRPGRHDGQHLAGGRPHRAAAVQPGKVALDQRGAGLPAEAAQGAEVQVEHHVAVPGLPGRDGVAVHGVHVDVDGQQVVAALGAVVQHGVEKEAAVDALALQPALHVGEGDDHGVDHAGLDVGDQFLARVPDHCLQPLTSAGATLKFRDSQTGAAKANPGRPPADGEEWMCRAAEQRGPPAYPPEPAYPCCLPALGKFTG